MKRWIHTNVVDVRLGTDPEIDLDPNVGRGLNLDIEFGIEIIANTLERIESYNFLSTYPFGPRGN